MSLWQTNVWGSGDSESISSSMLCDEKWIQEWSHVKIYGFQMPRYPTWVLFSHILGVLWVWDTGIWLVIINADLRNPHQTFFLFRFFYTGSDDQVRRQYLTAYQLLDPVLSEPVSSSREENHKCFIWLLCDSIKCYEYTTEYKNRCSGRCIYGYLDFISKQSLW